VADPPPTRATPSEETSAGGSSAAARTAQEDADRAEIEAQWRRFWDLYLNSVKTPADKRKAALSQVAVDPILSEVLNAATDFEQQGLDYYGNVTINPYWTRPVNGQPFAIMRDCQDQSKYGSYYVATGKKRSVGVERDSLQVGFLLGNDDVWRVQQLQYLENVPC
jgi:hypothetical protein